MHDEAILLAEYLLDTKPTDRQASLYGRAIKSRPDDLSFEKAKRHPRLLPYIDAYDAFFRPQSELRGRLYLMFSILEASTSNTDKFLPRQRSKWFMAAVPFIGLRAVWRLLAGTVIVKMGGF